VTPRDTTVLVTGASHGIGRMLAEWFAERGRTVVGFSRRPSDLDHAGYHHRRVDVTDEAAVVEAVGESWERVGPVGLLVANAGTELSSLGILTGGREAAGVLLTNALGTALVAREVLKGMRLVGRGRVVTVSSVAVPLVLVGSAVYGASKAAVEQLGAVLARENADLDITVNALGLSWFAGSGMYDRMGDAGRAALGAALVKRAPMGVDELGATIEFLDSDEARNITGQTLYFGGVS
jgi:3-oxoacyl-[acyl-carrier protein] reductase